MKYVVTSSVHVAVLAGGPSAEREVSLASGAAVVGALHGLGYRVSEVDPMPGRMSLPEGVDVAFLALHGTYGEDGCVQSELEALGIPYTGCDVEASRLAFDKVLTKERLVLRRIPTPRSAVVDAASGELPPGWEVPVVLKPARQGSSVGLQFVHRPDGWRPALEESLRFCPEVLMEEVIMGREVTVAILADEVLPVVEVRPRSGVYDYGNKYTPGATEYLCPAPFEPEVTRRIQEVALGAYRAVGARDFARVDVMVRRGVEPMVLEVNTLPGMTATSLLPKAAAAAGIGFPELCQRMLAMALERGAGAKRGRGHLQEL